MAAAFSIDKILDINNCCTIEGSRIPVPDLIDEVNSNIRQRSEATGAMAMVAGLIIPLGMLIIILRLFKISAGALGRIIVVAVNLIPKSCMLLQWSKLHRSAYAPQILIQDNHSCTASTFPHNSIISLWPIQAVASVLSILV